MTEEKIVEVCHHCGNRTTFEMRAEYEAERIEENDDLVEYLAWRILQCSSCLKPTFQEISYREREAEDGASILKIGRAHV